MDTHKNAPLTPKGREAMVRSVIEEGLTKAVAAVRFNTTAKTVAKWVERFRAEGVDGLRDRSSRPLSLPSQTPPATCAAVEVLRRQRHTGKQIAAEVGVSAATVSRILRRLGLNRMRDLEPAEPVRRYQREHPGELIHIDIKKLGKFNRIGHRITGDRTGQSSLRSRGKGPGWEYVHVCIDDASRIAFSQVMKNEKKGCAVAFLKAAVAYYVSLGVRIMRRKSLLVIALLAVLLLVAFACWPRRADLRAFDSAGMAQLETAMWRDYYEKRHPALFYHLYEVSRTQFGFSPSDSFRIA